MTSWLNYHYLRSFAAVVEEGGVAPAARRLLVSHPTISEQVHKLEDQLELQLFVRVGRRLQLTDEGKMVYAYASQIFGMGAALLDAAEGRRSGRTVVARVGIDSVLAKLAVRRILSPMMNDLGAALRLRCTESEREPLLSQLEARQLDLVLSDAPASESVTRGLRSYKLDSSSVALFAAPALVASLAPNFPDNLDGAPFLLPMPTTRLRRELERWMGERRLKPRIVAEIEDSGLIKALGQEACGVFAMPANLEEEVCAQYDVLCIGKVEEVELRVFAIARHDSLTNTAVHTLLEANGVSPG